MKLLQKAAFLLLCAAATTGCKQAKQQPEAEKLTAVINGHEYHYDVVSGATVENKEKSAPMSYDEKLQQMYWSPKPALGFFKGDYYHAESVFDEGHTAMVDVVKDGDKVVFVELDEIASPTYYAKEFAGASKRYSGYAFLQAKNQRTDKTLVTLVNSLTFLEYQMVQENRLTGDFKTVRGSSNSINRGFLPAIAKVAEQAASPSSLQYYGIVKDMGNGITARLAAIVEGGKIVKLWYDEIFDDTPDAIADPELKQFFRQSKYHSTTYPTITGVDFKRFANELASSVIESQNMLEPTVAIAGQLDSALQSYLQLAAELKEKM